MGTVAIVDLLRPGEVRPHALDLKPGLADCRAEGRGPLRLEAYPVHPGVHLHVDAAAQAGLRQSPQPVVRVAGRGQAGGCGLPLRAGGELAEHQDRRVDLGLAEAQALLDHGHAEPRGPRLQGRPGHRDVAVPVPVRLHHGHELGEGRLEGPDVVTDGLKVHLGHGGPERPGHEPSVTRRTASGTARATSPATVPSPVRSPARRPARPWTKAPTEAASTSASPRAAMAAMAPVSTSPVPPVASTEVPLGLTRTWPSCPAINVLDPLRRVTHPVSAAALRTRPTGSSATSEAGMPNRRAGASRAGVMRAPADRPARAPPP